MKASILVCLGLMAWLGAGCLGPVPIPSYSEARGRALSPAEVRFVQAGQTTRSEVCERLGTNYSSLWHERAIAYSWEKPGWSFTWSMLIIGYSGAAAVPLSDNLAGTPPEMAGKWQAYFIKFDDQARVSHAAFYRLKAHIPLHQQLDAWACRQPPTK
jgi:hypothetical protein